MPHDVTKRRLGKTKFARALRKNDTEEEYRLWSDLRNRRLNGFKFVRQIPLGPFIADFLCREQHLIVELDGGQHGENWRDKVRTAWLNANGYSVIRFWNNEVLGERAAVLETILAVLEGRLFAKDEAIRYWPCLRPDASRPPPHPALSPRGEEAADEVQMRSKQALNPPLPSGRGQGEGAVRHRGFKTIPGAS